MSNQTAPTVHAPDDRLRRVVAFIVTGAAVAATVHGLFEVATHAGVPSQIAWLWPLMTDGLAVLAYLCTGTLPRAGRRYAWGVIILSAGLSGAAQAAFLAGGLARPAADVAQQSAEQTHGALGMTLGLGVGAWPAIACALAVHLLVMARHTHADTDTGTPAAEGGTSTPTVPLDAPAAGSGMVTAPAPVPPVPPAPDPVPPVAPAASAAPPGAVPPAVPGGTDAALERQVSRAALDDEAARQAARSFYVRKQSEGVEVPGAELGRMVGRSARWGRAQREAARAQLAAERGTDDGTVVVLPRHRAGSAS